LPFQGKNFKKLNALPGALPGLSCYGLSGRRQASPRWVAVQAEDGRCHHRKVSFQDEFRTFLQRYGIEYDERYVWD
jgi:hypothetical protein